MSLFNGVFNASSGASSVVYGVNWNPTTDTYERTGIAAGVALSTSYAGVIQTKMKRCVLNADGTVKYYLSATDSTKKADGSTAIIDGTDGNVMVEIPKFWYKYENVGGVHKWSISDAAQTGYEVHPAFIRGGVEKSFRYYCAYQGYTLSTKLISGSGRVPTASKTRATFRTEAAANGTGWSQIDWNLLIAVQLLYLVEYANFNTQAMLGQGITSGGVYTAVTGSSNSLGNASSPSTNTSTQFMSYRGIENWYGQIYEFIDGVNVDVNVYYVNNNPATFADDVFTGDYVNTGITSAKANGYVKDLIASWQGFVVSRTSGGSGSTTFVPDYFYQATGIRVVVFGGYAASGEAAGGFSLSASIPAASSSYNIGSGVSF